MILSSSACNFAVAAEINIEKTLLCVTFYLYKMFFVNLYIIQKLVKNIYIRIMLKIVIKISWNYLTKM